MNYVCLPVKFVEESQLNLYEKLNVRIENRTIITKISMRNRVWKIPLGKLGFKLNDEISFIKTGTRELTIEKTS